MTNRSASADKKIATQMFDLARERGTQSDDELRAEGFTTDEIRRCAPLAARMLREADTPMAA